MATTTVGSDEISSGPISLTANTEEIVDFSDEDLSRRVKTVEVLAIDATQIVYVSSNETAATVGGRHCYPIPPGTGSTTVDLQASGATKVRVISGGTATIVVTKAS